MGLRRQDFATYSGILSLSSSSLELLIPASWFLALHPCPVVVPRLPRRNSPFLSRATREWFHKAEDQILMALSFTWLEERGSCPIGPARGRGKSMIKMENLMLLKQGNAARRAKLSSVRSKRASSQLSGRCEHKSAYISREGINILKGSPLGGGRWTY